MKTYLLGLGHLQSQLVHTSFLPFISIFAMLT